MVDLGTSILRPEASKHRVGWGLERRELLKMVNLMPMDLEKLQIVTKAILDEPIFDANSISNDYQEKCVAQTIDSNAIFASSVSRAAGSRNLRWLRSCGST